jgi:hypothetical protein
MTQDCVSREGGHRLNLSITQRLLLQTFFSLFYVLRHRWARLLKHQTSFTVDRLPTRKKCPFPVSFFSKQTEVCRFRFSFVENKRKLPFSVSSVLHFRNSGNVETWKWRHEDKETWRQEDMENGDLETWRHGDRAMHNFRSLLKSPLSVDPIVKCRTALIFNF